MTISYVDDCIFLPAAGGTVDFVYSSTVTGYQSPAAAGATDGLVYEYRAQSADLSQWENGSGAWTASSTTLARTTISASSNAGAAVNFSAPPQVSISISATSINAFVRTDQAQSFTNAQQAKAAGNLGLLLNAGGRLTLTTATPVMTATTSAQGTVYYTPYLYASLPLWNGALFAPNQFSEASQALTDATKSPAAAAANSNYDVFGWLDGTTFRATRGPAWTSDTARGTGAGTTELQLTTGILNNKNAITNGPGAGAGTYLGTIRTNGSSLVDWIYGAAASGGTAASLGVWNMYNRVLVSTQVSDNGVDYTYSTASWRQARSSSGMQISFIAGRNEDGIAATYTTNGFATSGNPGSAIGYDTVSTFSGSASCGNQNSRQTFATNYAGATGLGWHYVAAVELGSSGATFGPQAAISGQSALVALLRM